VIASRIGHKIPSDSQLEDIGTIGFELVVKRSLKQMQASDDIRKRQESLPTRTNGARLERSAGATAWSGELFQSDDRDYKELAAENAA
jgi:hypothetical protein